ncbi:MAG: xanthine dehydrogenase family protein molybdopterin-binding subunit [Chitinophagaceae bacterium]|nr:MAG: xanthine dehydrogenase family protein molybdopterin-binding subunit [Chitinophagaceae bacterium]
MNTNGMIGQSVRRVEDKRFITGKGRYTDDIILPGQTYAAFVRSTYAHAKVTRVDSSAAKAMPGVIAVFTGEDVAGLYGNPCGWQMYFKNGEKMKEPLRPLLVTEKARHVGDPIAMIIAESRELAMDALDSVEVEYEELPVIVNAEQATKPGAPLLHEGVTDNICFDWELGNPKAEVDEAMAASAHVTTLEFVNQRLIPNAIEPRSYIGDYDSTSEKYTVYTSTQNPHLIRLLVCAFVLGIPENKVRVVGPDVGGGFGSKAFHYSEEALVTWASKKVNRPVKWTAERHESFLLDAHGRDHITKAEMGFDNDGKIQALRVKTFANLGAYLSAFSTCVPTFMHGTLMQGLYTTPKINVDVTAVFTNTNSVDAYRGAGRPEATYLLERLMDLAALEMGRDPAALRFKNFIPPFDGINQPGYQTQVALQYDSGNYHGVLTKGLELLGYSDFRDEQKEASKNGKLLGVGFSTYVEACGLAPTAIAGALGARVGLYEVGEVRVQPTGKVCVFTGSHSHGQGHETAFAQIVADKLGIPMEDIDVVHGDTDSIAFGMGTYGSRSLAVGGSAIVKSVDKIIEKGKKIAAHKFEASADDIEFASGKFSVKGTDKSVSFAEISLTAYVPHVYPAGLEPGLDFTSFYDPTNFTYPFGCHIAVVEVDKEIGEVKLKRFIAIDDVGNVVNPMLVEGQIHGGVAQGIGQALFEGAEYDSNGQLTNGSYMDYCIPRADDLPMFETGSQVTPCPHNPLGVKGAGEAGTIGSTPAVVNAVLDALWSGGFKVKDIRMPLTSERVWKAMQS